MTIFSRIRTGALLGTAAVVLVISGAATGCSGAASLLSPAASLHKSCSPANDGRSVAVQILNTSAYGTVWLEKYTVKVYAGTADAPGDLITQWTFEPKVTLDSPLVNLDARSWQYSKTRDTGSPRLAVSCIIIDVVTRASAPSSKA